MLCQDAEFLRLEGRFHFTSLRGYYVLGNTKLLKIKACLKRGNRKSLKLKEEKSISEEKFKKCIDWELEGLRVSTALLQIISYLDE